MNFLILTRKRIFYCFAWFVLGLMLGITGSMLYAGWSIDQKVIELDTLYSEISERDSRIERLEDSLAVHRYRIVSSVKIELNIKDPHLNLKISDSLRPLLIDLIGEEITKLDPNLIRNIIDGRVLYINDQSFTCKLSYLVIAETVIAKIEVITA